MKVLMISTDRKIFEEGSAVRDRMIEYGDLFEELHVIVFSPRGFSAIKLGKKVHVYPTNSSNRFFRISDAVRIGKKILPTWGNDGVITCQDPFETGIVGRCLSKRFKLKLQLQIHTDLYAPSFRSRSFLNRLRVFTASVLLPKANSIRVVSARIKEALITHGIAGGRITVLPILVDQKKLEEAARFNLHDRYKFKIIILVVSRLEAEKNVDQTVAIFEKIGKEFPDAALVIVGDGSKKESLVSQAKRLGISEKVFFEGWQNDLVSYYKTADIFLAMSSYEGYGLTLVEAALCGLPILTSDVGLVSGVLHNEKEVLVCPVGDTRCFTKELKHLIADPVLRQRLSEAARTGIQVPSKEQYYSLYKQSLSDAFNS